MRDFAYRTPKGSTHRSLSSSFLGLPYRILNITHKKEPYGPMGNQRSPTTPSSSPSTHHEGQKGLHCRELGGNAPKPLPVNPKPYTPEL